MNTQVYQYRSKVIKCTSFPLKGKFAAFPQTKITFFISARDCFFALAYTLKENSFSLAFLANISSIRTVLAENGKLISYVIDFFSIFARYRKDFKYFSDYCKK